jgi:hypothetical protein
VGECAERNQGHDDIGDGTLDRAGDGRTPGEAAVTMTRHVRPRHSKLRDEVHDHVDCLRK